MDDSMYVQALRAIREHSGLALGDIRAAGEHGADTGWGGFVYYDDTSEFVANNRELVWRILADDAQEYGYDNVPAFVASFNRADIADDETGFDCLLAWYVLETVGHRLNDRREERIAA